MTDLRSTLIERMNALLEQRTARYPTAIPVVVPTADLADIAIEALSEGRGVPRLPDYQPQLLAQRVWYEPTSAERLGTGLAPRSLSLALVSRQVAITATEDNGLPVCVALPLDDAEEFALYVLAAVAAGRAETSN
jgi:hypothetical protein